MQLSIDDVWSPKLEIGIEFVDNHHRALVGILVDTHNAIETGFDRDFTRAVVDALKGYAKYHFLAEERLMLESRYPYIDLQREAHARFIEKVETFSSSIGTSSAERMREMYAFLKDWLVDHILVKDKDLGLHWNRARGPARKEGQR